MDIPGASLGAALGASLSNRQRFLLAGRQALASARPDILINGLVVERDVAPRAGLSKQTFSTTFPRRTQGGGGKAQFIDELLGSLMQGSTWRKRSAIETEIATRIASAGGDPRVSIRAMSRWDFEQAQTDPGTQLRFVVAALAGNHAGALKSVRSSYADITTASAEALVEEFKRWGSHLRQPFSFQKLAVLVTALAEGLQLRAKLDPDAVSPDLFGDAIVALIGATADPEQTHTHIDDVIAPLVEKAIGGYTFSHSDIPDDPAQAIIDVAAVEFAKRGYFNTTRTQIATASGVPPALLDRLFPTTADIVVAALRPLFDRLKQRTTTDATFRPPEEVLRRYLEQLADLLCTNRSMAEAMTLVLSMERFQSPTSATELLKELNFPSLIRETVEAGQRDGRIVADVPAIMIATTLVNNVLFLCLRDPSASPAAVAAMVDRLSLRGLLRTSRGPDDDPVDRARAEAPLS